jgi:hypothetical protein
VKLLLVSAALVLLLAAAVWIELWLWRASAYIHPKWLRTVLGLSGWLFVPALALGFALALYARKR